MEEKRELHALNKENEKETFFDNVLLGLKESRISKRNLSEEKDADTSLCKYC